MSRRHSSARACDIRRRTTWPHHTRGTSGAHCHGSSVPDHVGTSPQHLLLLKSLLQESPTLGHWRPLVPSHHLLLLLLLLHHLHPLLLLLLHHHPLLLLLLHGHPTALLHHRLLPSTLHHPHLPLLLLLLLHLHLLLLLLLLLLHVWLLAHAQVSKISRPSPLGSPAGLLPHVKNQPRDEAQILLLGLGSHEHLKLSVIGYNS